VPTEAAGTLSVLLPVHAGIDPVHFDRALTSMVEQTHPADEIVVVEDGPLTDDLRSVIDRLAATDPHAVVVRLVENSGAGVANQAGLQAASGTWIVKMDADDICLPHRIATQVAALASSDADVCGAAMLEFEGEESNVVAIRRNPTSHDEIARRMRINNPVNHPTAVFRRDRALAVGGYPELRFMQDYDLFARMLADGARFINLAEPLVLFRADPGMFRRRRARAMFGYERILQRNLAGYGLISRRRAIINLVLRGGFRLLPPRLLRATYSLLFRRRVERPESW